MDNVMLALHWLGIVTIVGLVFVSENRNHGVSRFINAVGSGVNTINTGIGPGVGAGV